MGGFLKIFSSRKTTVFSFCLVGLSSISCFGIWKNMDFVSSFEGNYLAKIRLSKLNNNSKTKEQLVTEDKERLDGYYKKYGSKDVSVNVSEKSSSTDKDVTDIFLRIKSSGSSNNLNKLWLENVKLNQLSIDRYGFEYDESGLKKSDSNAKVHEIVKWENISLDSLGYSPISAGGLDYISFNLSKDKIEKKEVDILINEDDGKYKADDTGNTSNNWFVWLDKDILSLKLNYALKTYIFNQESAASESSITSIIGTKNNRNTSQTQKFNAAKENFGSLSDEEKKFAEDYITTFIDTSASSIDKISNWGTVVSSTVGDSYYIKTDDLNKIYNSFTKSSKSTSLFDAHLVSEIKAGKDDSTWKQSLNLSTNKDEKGENTSETKIVSRDISPINESSSHEDKSKNKLKIFSKNLSITSKRNFFKDLYEQVKNHSVRNFSLKTKENESNDSLIISSAYSSSSNAEQNEIFYVLPIITSNHFGLSKLHLIPCLLGILFLSSVGFYIIKAFKAPGGVFVSSIVGGILSTGAVFFTLGSKLSIIGVAALSMGVLYALFLSFYSLSLMRRLFSIEFLGKNSLNAVFKRSLVFSVDLSFPLFVFSSLVSFLAPSYFREFGIVLTLCIIFFFLFVSIFANWVSIGYVNSNFLKISNFYRSYPRKISFLLSKYESGFGGKKILVGLSIFLLISIISFSLIHNVGFNSFSFLKENYLLIFDKRSSGGSTDLISALDDLKIKNLNDFGDSAVGVLIEKSPEVFNKSFSGTYYLQLTNDFSDVSTLRDLAFTFGTVCLFVLVYIMVRFGIKNLFIFSFNLLLSFLFFISVLFIFRIFVNSIVFLGGLALMSFVIFYNMLFFNNEKNKKMDWFGLIGSYVFNDVYGLMKKTIFLFLFLSLLSMNEEFVLMNLYMSLAMLIVHYFSTFIYYVFFNSFNTFKGKYIKKSTSSLNNEEFENLDKFDEEIILDINCF